MKKIRVIDLAESSYAIKQNRIKNHYSRSWLAKDMHVSVTAIYKWENAEGLPSIDNLVIMTGLFGCKVEDLIKWRDM